MESHPSTQPPNVTGDWCKQLQSTSPKHLAFHERWREMVTAIARPGTYNCTAFGYKRKFSSIGCLTMPLPCFTIDFLNVNSPGPIVGPISNSQTTGSEVSLGKCFCHFSFECSLEGVPPRVVFILQSYANLLGATFDVLYWLQRNLKGPCPVPVAVAATP